MPTEEQLLGNQFTSTPSSRRAGQKLTISNRVVTKLSFKLKRTGTLSGNYLYRIRRASNDAILATIDMGPCSAVTTGAGQFYEGTFGTPVLINEEVYICQEMPTQGGGGNLGVWNSFNTGGDVKPGEEYSIWNVTWADDNTKDYVYIYTYILPVPPDISSVAASGIAAVEATPNGNVDAFNDSAINIRGFVWDTVSRADPGDVAPDASGYSMYWVETGSFGLGAFFKAISGLHPGPTYYFRAAGRNNSGKWDYGEELSFQCVGTQLTEEQTMITDAFYQALSGVSFGQKLTINNRLVSKLSFPLKREGSPGGTLTFLIRKVSDDSIVASKAWGNSNDVPVTLTWLEVTFNTPVLINEEVYILASGSLGGVSNTLHGYSVGWGTEANSEVKAGEVGVSRTAVGVYTEQTGQDTTYIYTFLPGKGLVIIIP